MDLEADMDTCFAVDFGKDSVTNTGLAAFHFAANPEAFHPAVDFAALAHLVPAVGIAALAHLAPTVGIAATFATVASVPDSGALDFAADSAASVAADALDPSHRQVAFATNSPAAARHMQVAALHREVPQALISALPPCFLYPQALLFSPRAQAIPLPRGRSS